MNEIIRKYEEIMRITEIKKHIITEIKKHII